MTAAPSFRWWDAQDPAHFLEHDWQNPSREWATGEAIKAVKAKRGGSLLEVGPGNGVDYERHFRTAKVRYTAYEGSLTLCNALRERFPTVTWRHAQIADLPPLAADVVYARHVLEHQPALEPALGQLLDAAKRVVVLTWYRPPAPIARCDFYDAHPDIPCQTFALRDVQAAVERAGFVIADCEDFVSGDQGWLLQRRR